MRGSIILLTAVAMLFGCTQPKEVDLVIHNAIIYKVDDAFSKAEAMAVHQGKIVAIGAEHAIMNAYSGINVVDAEQRPVYPGFIDAHSHFLGYGLEAQRLDLTGTVSFDEVVERIQAYTQDTDNRWVLGRGWDQNDWEDKRFPVNDTLDKLFPDHYIALKRVDGHAYLASGNVLELAGIEAHTDVAGGKIIAVDGRPTGVVIDEAMSLIADVIPEIEENDDLKALQISESHCFQYGLTSVCDAGLDPSQVRLIDKMQENGELRIRIYAMYSASSDLINRLDELRIKTDRLSAHSVKLYADGALGSRGARLLEPYSDEPDHQGLLIVSDDSVKKWAEACMESEFQLNVHCIGDAANRMVLQSMGTVLGGSNDRRWRIEHAQVVDPDDRSLFGTFNIIPSMQPTHATSDMYWIEDRLGHERIASTYCLNSLMGENGLVALGTDFPVEGISPLLTYYAAVVRKDLSGYPEDGFHMDESLSRNEALRGITMWAAIANFEEETRGSLEVGKFADFVILDGDLMVAKDEKLPEISVLETWVNGELVYKK